MQPMGDEAASSGLELDDFAQGVYGAYRAFRLAGFEEAKAFILARDFLRETVRAGLAANQVTQ